MKELKLNAALIYDKHSPWFAGHFPGNPILPGIAQIKAVSDLITSSVEKKLRLTGLSRIKFRKIVKPAEQLEIRVVCEKDKYQYLFYITSDNNEVCSGRMSFTPIKK